MFKGPQGMSLAGNAAATAFAAATTVATVAVVNFYCSTIFLNGHRGQIGL